MARTRWASRILCNMPRSTPGPLEMRPDAPEGHTRVFLPAGTMWKKQPAGFYFQCDGCGFMFKVRETALYHLKYPLDSWDWLCHQ